MSKDCAPQSDLILIDWFGDIYALWCWKCRMTTESYAYNGVLRCKICNWKQGEKLDEDYAKMLKENGQLQ